MPSIHFPSAPNSFRNANLYQHALETIRFVGHTKEEFQKFDNVSDVDLNGAPGDVVVTQAQPFDGTLDLAERMNPRPFDQIRGQSHQGKLQVKVSGPGRDLSVHFEESPTEEIFGLPEEGIEVRRNRQTGELKMEYGERPDASSDTPGVLDQEYFFASKGPQTVEEAQVYAHAKQLKSRIETEIQALRAADGTSADLNPEPGTVVVAGFSKQGQLTHSVASEASLHYDPSTSAVHEFQRGYGGEARLSYRVLDGKEIFEENAFLHSRKLEVAPDGSWKFQTFLSTHETPEAAQACQNESRIRFTLGDRIAASAPIGLELVPMGLASAMVASVVAAATHSGPLAGAAALVTMVATSLLASPKAMGLELKEGLYRFQGTLSEQKSQARRAYDNLHERSTREENVKDFRPPAEGISRDGLRSFLKENREEPRLAILCNQFGPKGEPAVVVLDKQWTLPVQTEDESLRLPGGVSIPYDQISALSTLR